MRHSSAHPEYVMDSNRSFGYVWVRPYKMIDKKLGPHSTTTYKVSAPYRAIGINFDTKCPFTNRPLLSIYLWAYSITIGHRATPLSKLSL